MTATIAAPSSHLVSDDHALCRSLADAAGAILLLLRAESTHLSQPDLKEAGDRASHAYLAAALARHRPNDAVLSEGATDDGSRLSADRVWIIDPLDGTREFAEVPRSDWAVHVALWARGDLVAGAVARPAMGATLATDGPLVQPLSHDGPIRLAVSRTRPPAQVTQIAEQLGAELVRMGSAGIKATAVIDGTVDAYLHAGGQYEWDSAAPVVVARAAGMHTSRIDGSPLVYNQSDPYLPDLLVCRPALTEILLDAVAKLSSSSITSGGTRS